MECVTIKTLYLLAPVIPTSSVCLAILIVKFLSSSGKIELQVAHVRFAELSSVLKTSVRGVLYSIAYPLSKTLRRTNSEPNAIIVNISPTKEIW